MVMKMTNEMNEEWRNEMKWNDMQMIKWTLTANNIGKEEARMLSESLKTNTTLTSLNLSGDENE